MITTLFRIIKYGWQNFWRNRWLSFATVSILLLTLLIFQWLILFRVATNLAVDNLKDKVDISVYFNLETKEDDILAIQKRIEEREEVKRVEYISQEKALTLFKERHKDDPTINQALQELDANPLSASLNIKANNPGDYATIAAFLDKQGSWQPLFDKVTYQQNQLVIERLGKITDTAEKFGLAFIIFLAIAAVLVTFNTISLAIYSSREEIGVMRLIGSSNKFIVGPFVITGIFYSIIAAILSMIITWPLIALAAPHLKFFTADISLYSYFIGNFWKLFASQLILGIVLGAASGKIAIGRYLKI